MNVSYLNTDLDLDSSVALTPIVESFGADVVTLYSGKFRGHYRATFELAGVVDSPDSIIQHFCTLAETLDGEAKVLWDGCFSKVFDVGYESGNSHQSYSDDIRVGTIAKMAALGISLRITVYPVNTPSEKRV